MQKIFLNIIKFAEIIIFIFVFSLFFANKSFSEVVKINDVKITGNKNVSGSTILNIINLKNKNFEIELDKLNELQKKIFQSNFFSNVEVKISNDVLNIKVNEYPLIDYLIIEGLENNSEFKKTIEDKIFLRSDVIFSEVALNNDILYIKDFLSSQGYLKNNISFLVKDIGSNKVNIFLKINLNNKFSIKNIFFIGDKKFSSSKLLSIISSTQDSLFDFFTNTSTPSTDRLNYDMSKLKNFYLSEGYYDVQVANASIDLRDDKYVDLVFSINSGNKYFLSDYFINGNLNFLKNEDILFVNKIISKYTKNTYNNLNIDKLKNELLTHLESKNIIVNVNYNIKKTSNTTLSIYFNIEEILTKKIISNITIIGNDITEEKVIRNNIFFSEGDFFLQSKLDRSIDLLKSLNIFNKVTAVSNDSEQDNVSIKITIEEKPTGEISGGLSVGSAGSNISFNLKENNFFGQGIRTTVGLDLGTQEILGSVSFSNPDFNSSGNTLGGSIYAKSNSYNNAGYDDKSIGSSISIRYEIYKNIEFEQGVNLSHDTINTNEGSSSLIRARDGSY